jgi:hypothetical protein
MIEFVIYGQGIYVRLKVKDGTILNCIPESFGLRGKNIRDALEHFQKQGCSIFLSNFMRMA